MKATTLLLAALIISISTGTAMADRGNRQQDKIVTKHTTIVIQQPLREQNKSYKSQAKHKKGYTQPIIHHDGNRARIAQLIRAKQLQKQHNRHLAAQVQFRNQQRHEQLRSSTVILPLPIPRIALFFPW